MGDSLAILRYFPEAVREEIGYALYLAQMGGKHERAKPLRGFGPGVLEVIADHHGDTYRAVYTVRLAGRVYVLPRFRKSRARALRRRNLSSNWSGRD